MTENLASDVAAMVKRHILNCAHEGHRSYCAAICGPTPDNWYEDEKCDCSRKDALALIEKLGQGWIPVSERLPDSKWVDPPTEWTADISGVVNILTEHNVVGSAAYHRAKAVWFS